MTEPFDWAGLWSGGCEAYGAGDIERATWTKRDEAAAAYLRERIEAAFVPMEECRQWERLHDGLQDVAQGYLARAEAAAAELRRVYYDNIHTCWDHCRPAYACNRFIIAKPDPLVEALEEASGTNDPVEWANRFYAAIEKRGGKIVWGEE